MSVEDFEVARERRRSWRVVLGSGAALEVDAETEASARVKAYLIWPAMIDFHGIRRVTELERRRPRVEMSGAGHFEAPPSR